MLNKFLDGRADQEVFDSQLGIRASFVIMQRTRCHLDDTNFVSQLPIVQSDVAFGYLRDEKSKNYSHNCAHCCGVLDVHLIRIDQLRSMCNLFFCNFDLK